MAWSHLLCFLHWAPGARCGTPPPLGVSQQRDNRNLEDSICTVLRASGVWVEFSLYPLQGLHPVTVSGLSLRCIC